MTTRYSFDEVREALKKEWGLDLHRGGDLTDLGRDGRWDTCYSKTGFVVGGQFPGFGGISYRHYRSLARVVHVCKLSDSLARKRRG